jgi:hypothetical protein
MRAIKVLFKVVLYFFFTTVAWVGIYAIVPPPITATMMMDEHGISKDWTSFSDISPNMTALILRLFKRRSREMPKAAEFAAAQPFRSKSPKMPFSGKEADFSARDWKPISRS